MVIYKMSWERTQTIGSFHVLHETQEILLDMTNQAVMVFPGMSSNYIHQQTIKSNGTSNRNAYIAINTVLTYYLQ